MDIKQRLREARWHWWLPAFILVLICLLPSGHIEASPGEIFRPPVVMAPMGWPLLAMAVLFGAAAFSGWPRKRAWRIVFFGAGASLLFELIFSAFPGNTAIYSFGLGTDLQNRIFVDFELDVLAFGILPMDLLLVAFSFFVLWARHGKTVPAEPAPAPSALPGAPPPLPAEPAPSLPTPEATPPHLAEPGPSPKAPEAPPPQAQSAGPAIAASPLDAIAPGPPAPAPEAYPPPAPAPQNPSLPLNS